MRERKYRKIDSEGYPIHEIFEEGVLIGYRVQRPDWEFDGDSYSGTREILVESAGEDAPGIFKLIDEGYKGFNSSQPEIRIVSGETVWERARERALELAKIRR